MQKISVGIICPCETEYNSCTEMVEFDETR